MHKELRLLRREAPHERPEPLGPCAVDEDEDARLAQPQDQAEPLVERAIGRSRCIVRSGWG
ncbi:hypothetical protein BE21_52390 [Sorangium cellulosum]|uniref:Uncharacterized protein n=1 Tax=Sorangium cellulosum TaxID=56 RepID=A0A150TF25_SORCE|nr:hypothetical protein BE21_52390 [Sorangium cellulosum]